MVPMPTPTDGCLSVSEALQRCFLGWVSQVVKQAAGYPDRRQVHEGLL